MLKKFITKIKRRYLPPLIAFTAKIGMRLLLRTCRIQINGLDNFVSTANQFPCILALWHNRMAVIPEIMTKFAGQFIYRAFISKSRDGEPLALLTTSYSIGRVLRVPHNARHHALSQMIHFLKDQREIMVITPDGPRGPKCIAKPGIVMAAREAGAQIVPFSWQGDGVWELSTWDNMMIPKPFSQVVITFGKPLSFKKDTFTDQESDTMRIQNTLLDLID